MTIITKNNNPKNASEYARHRSVWKGQTDVLDDVVKNIKGVQGVKRIRAYHGTPKQVRAYWNADFKPEILPKFMHHNFKGLSGVDTWLGATGGGHFLNDVRKIWADFVKIYRQRSNDGNRRNIAADTTQEVLFMCHTNQYFDLIYSKHGYNKGKHWFFHWTSMVDPPQPVNQPANRATIDVGNDDEDGESVDDDVESVDDE